MPKVDIGDAEIYYESHGDGPPLMLVPGLGGGGSFWMKQVPEFAKDFRVIIHDHRGAGQSSHSLIKYTVDQMADDALKLMNALDIESAHYCGHSTGGAMGQIIAEDHPERIKSLVLSATWPGKDPYFRRCFATRKEVLENLGVEAYARASSLVLLPTWWISENDAAIDEMHKMLAVNQPPVEVMVGRIEAIMEFDRPDRLGDIKAPTLVICAQDDAVTPVHYSTALGRGINDVRLVVLERGGHFVPVLLPDDYNEAVGAFLREHL